MRAVVWKGPGKVSVDDVPDPRIESATDVLVRISTAGICGSDLHMYEGRTAAKPGVVMGHENMGVIEEVGDAVKQLSPGDRVVLPFNVSCGTCFNCSRGYTNACLVANDEAAGSAYGYVGMGPWRGGQAELLRVPWGEANCIKLPGKPGDDLEDDFLLLSDIFPTGYHAAEMAKVSPGTTVAVFGAGPVGASRPTARSSAARPRCTSSTRSRSASRRPRASARSRWTSARARPPSRSRTSA
jgi:glutathione-independent formaldehyde dehydrogenase